MGIYRDCGQVCGEKQDNISCFGTYTRKRHKRRSCLLQRQRQNGLHCAAVLFENLRRGLFYGLSLALVEPRGVNRRLNLGEGCLGKGLGVIGIFV